MENNRTLTGGVFVGILFVIFLLILIMVGYESLQEKQNTLILDHRLEPKRVLIDVSKPLDTVYIYDVSE